MKEAALFCAMFALGALPAWCGLRGLRRDWRTSTFADRLAARLIAPRPLPPKSVVDLVTTRGAQIALLAFGIAVMVTAVYLFTLLVQE